MKTKSFITYCLVLSTLFSFAQQDNKALETLIKTADSLVKIRKIDQARPYYFNAEKLAESLKDSSTLNLIYFKIGRSYRYQGNMPEAIAYYQKSEKLSQSLKDSSSYARTLGELGMSYSNSLQFDNAIAYYEKALKIQQDIGDTMAEAITLNAIAGAYFRNNDIENSLQFSRRLLTKAEKINNPKMMAVALSAIGTSLYEKGDYEQALTHRKKSLEICKKNTIPIPFELLANIATDYKSLKKTDSALVFYEEAKQIAINTNDALSVAKANHNLGELYNDLKDYTTSLEYFMKSYDYAQQVNHYNLLYRSSIALSRVHHNLDESSKALQFLVEHVRWRDSINKRSTENKLEEFSIQYKVEEKDEEIASLTMENKLMTIIIYIVIAIILIILASIAIWQIINKKRVENLRLKSIIEAEQKERKRIAQDLHDSLGQSLSALKMQVSAIQPSSEDSSKYKTLLKQVDSTYDELRDISHNIMPNTLIRLGLIPAIRELISDIATEGSPEIQLEHNDDFNTLDEGQSINLYRIIQEALVNSIKHAEATLVTISLEQHQDTLSLYIKDNGKGMEVSKTDNHDGMGWKNIYSRAALLSAKIDVTSAHGKGTSIALQLKSK